VREYLIVAYIALLDCKRKETVASDSRKIHYAMTLISAQMTTEELMETTNRITISTMRHALGRQD
jgi:two-component SAPR family response regulator